MSGGFRGLGVDLGPLRSSPALRALVASRGITLIGSQITFVAAAVQVKELTGSALQVGLLGAAEVVPIIVFSLCGGAIADRFDRRKVALRCELALAVAVAVLVANALLERPMVWPIYIAAAAVAGLTVLQRPSLDAAIPRLVPRDELTAAAVLLSATFNATGIVGPAIGGLLVAGPGAAVAYAVDLATFVVSAGLLLRLPPIPTAQGDEAADEPEARRPSALREGVRYAWGRQDLRGSYLVDFAAMSLAYPYALLPFLADRLDAPWAVGLLVSAGAVGALVASATSGWTRRVHRHGRAIVLAAAAWGASLALLGPLDHLALALVALGIAGAADMLSGVFRDTLWNQTVPDELRGRLAGIEVLSYGTGPAIGQLRGGVVAGATSVPVALSSGGLGVLVAVGLIAATSPKLLSYDARVSDARSGAGRELEPAPSEGER